MRVKTGDPDPGTLDTEGLSERGVQPPDYVLDPVAGYQLEGLSGIACPNSRKRSAAAIGASSFE